MPMYFGASMYTSLSGIYLAVNLWVRSIAMFNLSEYWWKLSQGDHVKFCPLRNILENYLLHILARTWYCQNFKFRPIMRYPSVASSLYNSPKPLQMDFRSTHASTIFTEKGFMVHTKISNAFPCNSVNYLSPIYIYNHISIVTIYF